MAYRLARKMSMPGKNSNQPVEEEERKEAAFQRLETLGYRVGQGLVER